MISLKIDHLGYAVNDITKSIKIFEALGYSKVSEIIKDNLQNIEIAFLMKDNYKIELISPTSDEAPITNYLKKNSNIPYHICYSTVNILDASKELRKLGFIKITKPIKAAGFDYKQIIFLYQKDYGLLELVEKGNDL